MTDEPMIDKLERKATPVITITSEGAAITLPRVINPGETISICNETNVPFPVYPVDLLSELKEAREALGRVRAMLTNDDSPHVCGRGEDDLDAVCICTDCVLAALAPETDVSNQREESQ